MELLPSTTFHRPNLDSIKEGEERERGRRTRHEFQWIVTNAATSSPAQPHSFYMLQVQLNTNWYLGEWDESTRGNAKMAKHKTGI